MEIRQIISIIAIGASMTPLVCQANNDEKNKAESTPTASTSSVKLAIDSRQFDPFGLNLDPHAKPKPKPVKVAKGPSLPSGPKQPEILLKQEIHKLKSEIKGIGTNRMIINNRFYKRGDIMSVTTADKVFKIQIVKIDPNLVIFRNLEDNNLIDLDMKRDSVFDPNKKTDIDLGSGNSNDPIDLDN